MQQKTLQTQKSNTQLYYAYCPLCGFTIAAEGRCVKQIKYQWVTMWKEINTLFCTCCGKEIANSQQNNVIMQDMVNSIKEYYLPRNYTQEEYHKRLLEFQNQEMKENSEEDIL